MSVYFILIIESTENATWLLLESAYPIGGRPLHRLREDWMECMELWVRRQVGYDGQQNIKYIYICVCVCVCVCVYKAQM